MLDDCNIEDYSIPSRTNVAAQFGEVVFGWEPSHCQSLLLPREDLESQRVGFRDRAAEEKGTEKRGDLGSAAGEFRGGLGGKGVGWKFG